MDVPDALELRRLLGLMAMGGRLPLIELDDWEFCLRELTDGTASATGRWFLQGLAAEWQQATPPNAFCAEVEVTLRAYMESCAGPWAPWWGHSLRVAGLMLQLASELEVDPQEAYLTALYHDIHKLDERRLDTPHPRLGAERALRDLNGRLPDPAVMRIVEAIAIHPDRPPSTWVLACLLHDCDKLDKIGATGLLRRVSEHSEHSAACKAATRSIKDMASFPPLCFHQSNALLDRKHEFTRAVDRLLRDACR